MPSEPFDLVEKAIEKGENLGAKYIEARLVNLSLNSTLLKNGEPEIGSLYRSKGIGIRVLKDGGMGFASFNEMNKNEMEIAVAFATKMAETTGKKRRDEISFSEEEVHDVKYDAKGESGKRPLETDPEEKINRLIEIDKAITEQKIEASLQFRYLEMTDQTEEKYLVTSEGSKVQCTTDRVEIYGMITVSNPVTGSMEQREIERGKAGGYEALDHWNIDEHLISEVKKLSKIATEAKESPKGILDYIAGPSVIGIICHENQGHPSEGDRILGREGAQAGESYLTKEMLGTRIGSEHVNVIDDPTIVGSYGFYLYDDEGVKARPRYLQKEGIFHEMLNNRESAAVLEVKSNAAARAIGYNREPIPRMANTYLEPGDFTLEEMLEDVKFGILMNNFTEWNIDDRRYQSKYVGLEAYLIENGEVKNLVRRPVLETTTPKLWQSVDAVAKKDTLDYDGGMCGKGEPMQGAPCYMGGTYMRIRDVEVR